MWLASLAQVLTLVAAAGDAGPTGPPYASSPLPAPIATRQTLFAIPFKVDKGLSHASEPVQVQLYVSSDLGDTWRMYQQVPPGRGRFLFQANGDGEYWFLIRTLDRAGQVRPRQGNQPGLRVVVDTNPPELKLDAFRGNGGQITARWQVADQNLNLESLRIQYRPAGVTAWQTLAIDRQAMTVRGITHFGEVTWWPQAASGRLEIRAEVADTAGNTTVTHAQVAPEPSSPSSSGPSLGPSPATPPALPPGLTEQHPSPATPALPPGLTGQHPSPATPGLTEQHPLAPAATPPAETPPATPATAPPSGEALPPTEGPVIPGFSAAQPPTGTVAMTVNPPLGNQYVPPVAASVANRPDLRLPDGRRPRMVNSRVFELEYKVDSVGPSGIRRLELWGTLDGGRTWSSFGVPKQIKSPLVVGVQREGLYGFRVAVENGAGVWSGRPRSGDPPDVWVGVDLTRPSVHIRDVRPSSAANSPARTTSEADSPGSKSDYLR
jgi:hypothetical protein